MLAREDARAYGIYRWVFDSGSLRKDVERRKLFPDDPHSPTEEVTHYYFHLKMHRHALRMDQIPRKLWRDVLGWVSIVAAEANRSASDDDIDVDRLRAIRQRQALKGW